MPASESTFALGIPAPALGIPTPEATTEVAPEVALFSVRKKSDGTVVAAGLSAEAAAALIAKAKQAKKASLELVA